MADRGRGGSHRRATLGELRCCTKMGLKALRGPVPAPPRLSIASRRPNSDYWFVSTEAAARACKRTWTPILAAKARLIGAECECGVDGFAQPITEAGLVHLVLAQHRFEMTSMSGAFSAVVAEFLDTGRRAVVPAA